MSNRCRQPVPLPLLTPSAPDPAQLRALAERGGYWRSLRELAGDEQLRRDAEREFSPGASEFKDAEREDGVARRSFLKLMGASLALAGGGGCFRQRPAAQIAPAVRQPEESVPGTPIFFASAMPFDGYGMGVLVESNEGRPTKIEGNPDHPASLGAADIFTQASVLDLYDPDRSQNVMQTGRITNWGALYPKLNDRLIGKRAAGGRGLRLLTGPQTSPTFAAQIAEFQKQFPQGVWHEHHPIARPADGESGVPFSSPVQIIYDFSKAKVIVSLAADFVVGVPGNVRYARQFADGRRVREKHKTMSRLYVAEAEFTLTGSMADERARVRPSQIEAIAFALADRMGGQKQRRSAAPPLEESLAHWVDVVVDDLRAAGAGNTLLVAGDSQSPAVHAVVHQINQSLGNVGSTVWFTDPVRVQGARPLAELVADMRSGEVDALIIMGGNPAYDAPVDLAFADALRDFSNDSDHLTIRLGSHYDETSFLCQWHVPESHYLESWGDVRAFDGTASIIQPLIAPMYASKSQWDVMEVLLGRPDRGGYEAIRDHWRGKQTDEAFEKWWLTTLQNGVIADTALKPRTPPALRDDAMSASASAMTQSSAQLSSQDSAQISAKPASTFEVLLRPDPSIWDGRYANNGWLQECPKPFHKLTWDNAAAISVKTSEMLGGHKNVPGGFGGTRGSGPLVDGDIVRVSHGGRSLDVPVIIVPGQADGVMVLYLGYGRSRGGETMIDEEGKPRGYNAYALRTSENPWTFAAAELTPTGGNHMLVMTRNHHAMSIEPGAPGVRLKADAIADPSMSDDELDVHNRRVIRTATLDEYIHDDDFMEKMEGIDKGKKLLSLYPDWDYKHGLQWGMVIDQTACIGCNACMIACQSENNIPVVGRKDVAREREMHWIRIDSYFGGPIDNPAVYHQPLPCMQCEDAPCEVVCPVGATTHSDEGLNQMTYNRCIGTRYCSNNCPYKVRRFNFLLFSDYNKTQSLQYNPDVTVRSRGVMEKCTYCIQRITGTRLAGEKKQVKLEALAAETDDVAERQRLLTEASTAIRDTARQMQTACQQTCPTEAIIFGNLRDSDAPVRQLKDEPTNYSLLEELTTKPRTTYLARITNPTGMLTPLGRTPSGEMPSQTQPSGRTL